MGGCFWARVLWGMGVCRCFGYHLRRIIAWNDVQVACLDLDLMVHFGATAAVGCCRVVIAIAGLFVCSEISAQQSIGGKVERGGMELKPSYQLLGLVRQVAPSKVGAGLLTDASSNSRFQRAALARSVAKNEADAPALGAGGRLVLDDLIGLAVQAHPEIAAKRTDLEAAYAGRDAARWQYFPTPSLQLRQQDKGGNVTVAAVQQPLWSGGRLDAGLDAANSRTRSANAAISEAQYSVALRVTGAWQGWMQARGRAEALNAGIARLGVYAESVRQRIKGGVSPEVDRELVESRLSQVQGDLAAARAAERSALSQLSQLIGRSLRSEELSFGKGVIVQLPAFEVLAEQSVTRSAAMRRLEAEVEAARHDTTQKRAALWPTLGVRAEYQRGDSSNVGVVTQDTRVMLVMDYVPGAGLSAAAGIDAAEARVGSLREGREAARRELLAKVAADYEDHQSSLARKRDILRTLAAATEVLASYDRLFVAGKRNWLDVLNAARELTQVETSLADVEALVVASYYRLRLHGGELPWQQEGGA